MLTHSILDGCDGELARLKFMQSRRGAMLDFWGDNIVHVAVLPALAVGVEQCAVARGVAADPRRRGDGRRRSASAALMFRHTVEDSALPEAWSGRLVGALASRDFIYVVVLLSGIRPRALVPGGRLRRHAGLRALRPASRRATWPRLVIGVLLLYSEC